VQKIHPYLKLPIKLKYMYLFMLTFLFTMKLFHSTSLIIKSILKQLQINIQQFAHIFPRNILWSFYHLFSLLCYQTSRTSKNHPAGGVLVHNQNRAQYAITDHTQRKKHTETTQKEFRSNWKVFGVCVPNMTLKFVLRKISNENKGGGHTD